MVLAFKDVHLYIFQKIDFSPSLSNINEYIVLYYTLSPEEVEYSMNDSIREILENLPPNYPINNLFVKGNQVSTSNFISFQGDVAFFRNNATIRAFKVSDIDVIDF